MSQKENKTKEQNLQWEAELADTTTLGFMMQKRARRIRDLAGNTHGDEKKLAERRLVKRELKMLKKVMNSRQMKMF